MMEENAVKDEHENENGRRIRLGTVIALPAGAYYCGACRRVLPEEQLSRHEPRRHPIVAAVFCADCRANGAAEVACLAWERNVYRQEFRSTRAKLRRLQGQLAALMVAPQPAGAAA